jgi:hypothetical protein
MNRRLLNAALLLAIVGLIAIVYWPVSNGGFVWADKTLFHNAAWLRYGDGWKRLIFHDFYDWVNYFRPLVVGLFVAEVRAFDTAPGQMHLVSLALHLGNTLLVGALAMRLTDRRRPTTQQRILTVVAMLLYGLHPALIEPVVWISCQAELLVTLFWLLGLLANICVQHSALRAAAVATCFFLAACAKESAAGLPLTLILFDWIGLGATVPNERPMVKIRALLRRQWPTYLAVLLAGVAYLALRYWAMGFLTQGREAERWLSWSRLQTACYVFLTYWRILVWPMVELGPLHIVDTRQFATFSAKLLAVDGSALAILGAGVYLVWKRRLLGALIAAVTIALLPVLRIVPVDFDLSLYHERYVMTGVAMACALLPALFIKLDFRLARPRLLAIATSAFAAVWLAVGVANIRITVPLWSDDAKLWIWELTQHPGSIHAQNFLLATYVERDDKVHAHEIADLILKEKPNCPDCMLNVAALAVNEGDVQRLQAAIELARASMGSAPPRLKRAFITATGQLDELQGDPQAAINAYQESIRMDPLDPLARMDLALLLARQGKTEDARSVMNAALPLFAPDLRAQRLKQFEAVLDSSPAATTPESVPPPH